MPISSLTLDYHIIHVHLHSLPNLVGEHLIHQTLVGRSSILETEWHYVVVEETLIRREYSLHLVMLAYQDLVVPGVCILEAE